MSYPGCQILLDVDFVLVLSGTINCVSAIKNAPQSWLCQ